jgi:hypothetical protein
MKTCKTCGVSKPLSSFYGKKYLNPHCKACISAKAKQEYPKLPECVAEGCSRKARGRSSEGLLVCRSHQRNGVESAVQIRRSADQIMFRNEAGEKHCNRCDSWLPESGFLAHRNRPDGLQCYCTRCLSDQPHNLSGTRRRELLALQGGRCAGPGCAVEFDVHGGPSVTYRIDHDHNCCPGSKSCGRCIRSLLCQGCNAFARNTEKHLEWAAFLLGPTDNREPLLKLLAEITAKLEEST